MTSTKMPDVDELRERNARYAKVIWESMAMTPDEREARKARLQLAPTPRDVMHQENSLKLYRFRPVRERLHPTPVVIVPSLILRYYIMDLMRDHSLIEYLVSEGIDVWLIDWGRPGLEHGHLGLGDYVDGMMRRCVRKVARHTGSEKVHMLGQCLGGTLGVVFASLYPERLASLTCLTAPVDFEEAGLLSLWTHKDRFNVDQVVKAFGSVVPEDFVHACFHFLDVKATVERYKKLYNNVLDENFMTLYLALDHWLNDKIPFPGQMFKWLIRDLYQENLLISGRLEVNGRLADLANISMPVLNLSAQFDHVFPERAVKSLGDAVSGTYRYHCLPTGHVTCVALFPQRTDTFHKIGDFVQAS